MPDQAPVAASRDDTLLTLICRQQASSSALTVLGRRGGADTVGYPALLGRAERIAGGLRAAGVAEPGSAVGLVLTSRTDLIAALLAVWFAGATVVLVPPPGPLESRADWAARTAGFLARTGSHNLLTDLRVPATGPLMVTDPATLVDHPAATAMVPGPDDVAVVTTTSGTTAEPRLVARTHGGLLAQYEAHSATKGGLVPGEDHRLGWGPLHRRALGGDLLYPLAAGVDTTLLPTQAFAARPLRWLEELSARGATFSTAPAFAYRVVARELRRHPGLDLDLRRWRIAHLAGERVSAEVLEDFAAAARPYGFDPAALCVSYGSREVGNIAGRPPSGGEVRIDRVDAAHLAAGVARPVSEDRARQVTRVVSVGPPNPGAEVQVHDELGARCAEREVGQVLVRTAGMISGYADHGVGSDRFRDGWFHTGDRGYLADGELFLLGRHDEVVVINGVNVHAGGLEQQVAATPATEVGGAVAFVVPGPPRDRLVVVAEVPDATDAVRDRILHHLRSVTERLPDEVRLVALGTLPRTEEGKLKRGQVAAAHRGPGGAGAASSGS